MERIPEPELMDQWEQARAYAKADFSAPHEMFVDILTDRFGTGLSGVFLDLGCGAADVTIRTAIRIPDISFHAVDGSEAMLFFAKRAVEQAGLQERILLFQGTIPDFVPPLASCSNGRDRGIQLGSHSSEPDTVAERVYDGAIINSLLHHLPSPEILWKYLLRFVRPGGCIFLMDLMRPKDREAATALVDRYCSGEPLVLRRDFYNSLLASYTLEEVRQHLEHAGLSHLSLDSVSDRHLSVWGRI